MLWKFCVLVLVLFQVSLVYAGVGCDPQLQKLHDGFLAQNPGVSASTKDPNGQTYYYIPCDVAVSGTNAKGCPANAILCQQGTNNQFYSCGNTAAIAATDSQIVVSITNGMDNRHASITILCANVKNGLGALAFLDEKPPLNYMLEWKTNLICSKKPPHHGGGKHHHKNICDVEGYMPQACYCGIGLCGGWITIIIASTFPFWYLLFGIPIQFFVFKKRGLAMIPNYTFWKASPFIFWGAHYWIYKMVRKLIFKLLKKEDYAEF